MGSKFEAQHPRDARGRFVSKSGGAGAFVVFVIGAALLWGIGEAGGRLPKDQGSSWTRAGYTFTSQLTDTSSSCGGSLAYGHVHRYLSNRPCTGLTRALFKVTAEDDGHDMLVSTAVVTMPTPAGARNLCALVDRPGTGNVSELGSVDFSGLHYDSDIDGRKVRIAQAEPALGHTPPAAELDRAATLGLAAPTD